MSEVDPLVGTVIGGKYTIVRLLGEGGMGCVYLGEQALGATTRKVAVKTLHQHLSNDPQVRARFQREVGTVAELEHPNTIQVYDFGTTDDGHLYIVMEYVQGQSVADVIEKTGAMAPERVLRILSQVAGSLEEAHGRGIVHRDLKPDNVVLAEKAGQKDWVEVLDFGIAKRSSETDPNEAKLTQQGMVLGTPPYMSPEQFTGQPIGPESDIYSLAVMAYEMLTGQLPFRANTAWEWASQHMTAQPSPFEAQPNGNLLPGGMRTAIMRALSKNPTERFSSANAFVDAMRGDGSAAAVSAPISGGGQAKTEMAMPAQAPMDFGAPAAAGPGYGPPPQQQGFHGGGAALPPAPAAPARHPQKKGNGLLIGAIVGVVAIVGIIIAVAASGGGSKTEANLIPLPSVTASTAEPVASTVAPPHEEPADNSGLAALTPAEGNNAGGGGGGTKPAGGSKPAASTKPSGTVPNPTPGGAKQPDQATQSACAQAKRLPPGSARTAMELKCKNGGGKI